MKKKHIEFLMVRDNQETYFDAVGVFDHNQLTFIDHENQKNSIILKKNKVEYIKMGDQFMHYSFVENEITKGIYRVDQFEFIFQIQTTYLKSTKERLNINFTLQQDDEIIGHHQLTLVYKDDEEDLDGL